MTTDTAVATRDEPTLTPFEVIERVISAGDLGKMTPEDRIAFYWRTCESLGLNPLTRPFEFIALNGKITLYARKDATDQLRRINDVSITSLRRERDDDLGLMTVYAAGRDRTGRDDEATGVVSIKGLSGEALANAVMKAETKAKRRLTLSLVGLGFLDETEISEGTAVDVDPDTGVIAAPAKPTLLEAARQSAATLSSASSEGDDRSTTITVGESGPETFTPTTSGTTVDEAAFRRSMDDDPDVGDPVPVAEGQVSAFDAAETATDAPQDAAVAETANAAATPEPLSRDAFLAALKERGIATQYATEVSKAMFPRASATPLSDEQRGQLLAALIEGDTGATDDDA